MTWQILDSDYEQAKITVLGIGGGGGNSVSHMIKSGIKGVNFICANTDAQDLSKIHSAKKIILGQELTQGLGAGNDPEKGRAATEQSIDEIKEHLENTEMLFITAGMGGGTGTGGAPIVAKLARDMGILTVGVVTTPFKHEGSKRANQAKAGISDLIDSVDSLIEIDNEKIFQIFPENTDLLEGFDAVDNVLTNALKSVTNVILNDTARMNIDFADVKAAMSHKGMAIMCYGTANGLNRAAEAVNNALGNPFFDQADMKNAKGLIVNVCASALKDTEMLEIMSHVQNIGKDNIEAISGLMIDESYGDEISVTIIATGLRRFNLDEFRPSYIPSPSINSLNGNASTNSEGYVNLNNLRKIDIKETLRRLKD